MDSTPETYNSDGAWRQLAPEDFNYSGSGYDAFDQSYHGEAWLNWGVQVSVLGKYDGEGNMSSLGLSFWGTGGNPDAQNSFWNMLSDVLSYGLDILGPADTIHNYVYNALNGLLTDIVNFATEHGLTGKDVIISGHSQGGLCVNAMASASALGKWDGFFEDSAYVALASPTQNNLDDKVLNIGLENDPVFRVVENDNLTWESAFIHDKPLATCTNNIAVFNDHYVQNDFFSILNITHWASGHGPVWYEKAINGIVNSAFYSATNLNSTVIVAGLSDELRTTTWVEDLNHYAREHSGPTFILGSDEDDLIQGGSGIDYLEGNAGNDTFRDAGGYNLIFGGEGTDTFDTQTHFDYWSWTSDSWGNLWTRDQEGNVSILKDVEAIKGGYSGWFGLGWYEVNGTVTHNGIEFTWENHSGFKSWDATSQATINSDSLVVASEAAPGQSGFLFGYFGNDTLAGTASDETFDAGQGNDTIITGGGKDIIMMTGESFGHDTIYNFGTDDKLVFLANSLIEDESSLEQFISVCSNDLLIQFNDESSVTLVGCASLGLDSHQLIAA
ncbi:hypothetical protein GWD52_19900 [Enterobacteriaceae bacterium 4M9]|nr:hypothetical protein [Enterobacteriaceae bacterium 4M9]